MNKKGTINLALIIVVVVVVGVLAYVVLARKLESTMQPSENQISTPQEKNPLDEKTYRNSTLGFEIQIPNTWVVYDTDPHTVNFFPAGKADDAPTGGSIMVKDNTAQSTLDSLFQAVKKVPYYHSFMTVTIGGQPAFIFESNEFATTIATILYQDKIFTLSNELVTDTQILSSFKFIY